MPDVAATIKRLIFETILNEVIKNIISTIPFFGVGPLAAVTSWIVTKIAAMIYDHLARVVSFQLIAADVIEARDEYKKAVANLATAQSEEEIARAKADFKHTLGPLIRQHLR